MVATWLKLLWERLRDSSDPQLAAIAGKSLKEARYHLRHSPTGRCGWATAPTNHAAAARPRWQGCGCTRELFEDDAVDTAAQTSGLGPAASELREPWLAEMREILDEATLTPPADTAFRSSGKRGVHSEHMGYILSKMQFLQRVFPGAPGERHARSHAH